METEAERKERLEIGARIGGKIRAIRERRRLSQAKFGKKIGASQKCISSWERGQCMVPTLKLFQIAKLAKERLDFFEFEDDVAGDEYNDRRN